MGLEIGRDPVFEHAEPQILEPVDLGLREVLELRVGERGTAPERQRLSQQPRSLGWLGVPRLAGQPLEAEEVELTAVELEHVARRPRVQKARAQQLAELRDRVLERGRCGARWVLTPELVDEALGREGLVCPQEQECQEGTLISAAELHRRAFVQHLERTEDSELEHASVVTGFTSV